MQTFDEVKGFEIILPIVSLDLLNFDQSNSRNVIKYKHFNNYIDLNFKNTKTITRKKQECSVQILAQNSNCVKCDKYILVYRIDMKNVRELFVTLSDSTHDLRVSNLNGVKLNTQPRIRTLFTIIY